MAFNRTTQNYALPQWDNNDKPEREDFNDAFFAIDAQLGNMPGAVDSYTKAEVDTRLAGVNTQIAGKANTSHASTATTHGVGSAANFGHVKAATANPAANGTASPGTDNGEYARGNHVHPISTAGKTMTGQLIAQTNAAHTTAQVRNVILSTANLTPHASGLADGSIYIRYE